MKRIVTTVDAPPAVVWTVLADLPAYDEWHPQTPRATGTSGEGERSDSTFGRVGVG